MEIYTLVLGTYSIKAYFVTATVLMATLLVKEKKNSKHPFSYLFERILIAQKI